MEQDKELNIKMLFASLAEKGIVEIHIGFDGSGDSGSIDDDITCYVENSDSEQIPAENISDEVKNNLSDLGYHILYTYYNYDWYNNEGGYGTIHISIKNQDWDIEGYQRTYDTVEVSEAGDLSTTLDSFIKD